MEPATQDSDWWRQAVVYQVYPRSFCDSNGDGLGDLAGVRDKADYLAQLGVDAVWLSPFYPSDLADGGYDVADYRNVDPRLGSLAEFDEMLSALHERGIRVIVDIVPNHTSIQHQWFRDAIAAGPGSEERDKYIFRRGLGADGEQPPADWVSAFGGPAWSPIGDGDWYFHYFAREQPDLNWNNEEVRRDFEHTLRFWSDRGVDGFRVDVAQLLAKDLPAELPTWAELNAIPIDGQHPIIDRDEVHEIYSSWREVLDSYDPPRAAVAEAWVDSARVPLYARPDSLGQAFNFDLLQADFEASQFREIISRNLELAREAHSSSTWVLSNHDVVRHATRYGLPNSPRDANGRVLHQSGSGFDWLLSGGRRPTLDRAAGSRRARAALLVTLALPGSVYMYQGEELGLHEVVEIDSDRRQDPTFFRTSGTEIGRDGCRVPLPWAVQGPSFGFSCIEAHLPQPPWFADFAVEVEEEDPESMLSLYRDALSLRRELQSDGDLTWHDTGNKDVLCFSRPNGWRVIANFGDKPHLADVDFGRELLSSGRSLTCGVVPAETSVWFLDVD